MISGNCCPAGDPCPGSGCPACCPSYDPCHQPDCVMCNPRGMTVPDVNQPFDMPSMETPLTEGERAQIEEVMGKLRQKSEEIKSAHMSTVMIRQIAVDAALKLHPPHLSAESLVMQAAVIEKYLRTGEMPETKPSRMSNSRQKQPLPPEELPNDWSEDQVPGRAGGLVD